MTEKVIDGIKCNAEKCVHHTKDNNCTADCIQVGYSRSCSSSETACETFREK